MFGPGNRLECTGSFSTQFAKGSTLELNLDTGFYMSSDPSLIPKSHIIETY